MTKILKNSPEEVNKGISFIAISPTDSFVNNFHKIFMKINSDIVIIFVYLYFNFQKMSRFIYEETH